MDGDKCVFGACRCLWMDLTRGREADRGRQTAGVGAWTGMDGECAVV
jgi:hypothetical protein